jgi:hypothetical protein
MDHVIAGAAAVCVEGIVLVQARGVGEEMANRDQMLACIHWNTHYYCLDFNYYYYLDFN